MNPENRQSCGKSGITKDECTKKGCCFSNKTWGTHWCFYKRNDTKHQECSVNPENRVECGHAGITKAKCTAKDCCYNSNFSNAKWCYKK